MQTLELVLIIDKNPLREKRTLCRVIKVYLKGLFKVSWASQALFLGMYCNTSKHIYWTCVCVCVLLWQAYRASQRRRCQIYPVIEVTTPIPSLFSVPDHRPSVLSSMLLLSPPFPRIFEIIGPPLPRITITASDSILFSFLTSSLGWFFFSNYTVILLLNPLSAQNYLCFRFSIHFMQVGYYLETK